MPVGNSESVYSPGSVELVWFVEQVEPSGHLLDSVQSLPSLLLKVVYILEVPAPLDLQELDNH